MGHWDSQLFRDVFNTSPIGIAVENLDGQPLFVNPAFCSFLGFDEEELLTKHCADFSPQEDAEKDWALFQNLRAGSIDRYQLEKRYVRKNRSLVWGRLSISLMTTRSSTLVIAMVEDITAKKVAEEAVRISDERLRLAQRAARIGTFERNVRTGLIVWSPEMEAIYGLGPGEFGGTYDAFQNLLHPDDRTGFRMLVDSGSRTGQPTQGEWRVIWPDGSIHWIAGRFQVLSDESGEPLRVVGANIDITERKQTEHSLLEANALLQSREELLKNFVKNVPAGVAMLDRDMRYLQVSERWCADYGADASQIIGRSHYEVFPEQPDHWREVHRRALAGETLRADEDRWDRQGGPTWVRWEVRPWKTATEMVGGILILAEDITERKRAIDALADLSRKLIEAQEQERRRIGRELHDDINQQLAMLQIELEKLRDNPGEIATRVQELLKTTREISSDVQALSHELHSSKLEYLGVAGGMKSWCKEFAQRQEMEIDCKLDIQSTLPTEVGLCLFRVLQEALHNAAKHSGVKRIDVQLYENSGAIHLIVRDLGRGFEIEAARLDRGLGLTSMQERVRLVNGTITIESRPMGGTTIHVRAPLEFRREAKRAAS